MKNVASGMNVLWKFVRAEVGSIYMMTWLHVDMITSSQVARLSFKRIIINKY